MKQPLKFNNVELPEFIRVVGRSISVLPPVSVVSTKLPNSVGQRFNRIELQPREYKFDIKVVPVEGFNLDEQIDQFQKWLIGNEFQPSQLIFKEQQDRYMNVVVTGNTDITDLFIAGEGSFTLRADNPLKYLLNKQNTSGKGAVTVNYSGTRKEQAVIEVTLDKACKKVELLNDSDSKRIISLSADFKAGQKLTIDCRRKLVKLNGKVDMNLLNLSSDWFFIMPKSNRISFKQDGQVATTGAITVSNDVAFY